jgi:hypothetical protein
MTSGAPDTAALARRVAPFRIYPQFRLYNLGVDS